jgi:YHS domain-containing protein
LSDGEVGACWLDQSFDPKVGGRPVKFAKTNPENRFQNELIIDSVACQCCRIAMSGDNGKITVAFRDIINDSIRDMSVSSSDDNGKTFTSAIPFSNDNWIINGCPHNGPSLALSGSSVYAAWFTGGQERGVYYGELNDKKEMVNKQLLSVRGRFVQLCLLKDGSRILVYNENVQGEGKSYNKIVLTRFQHDKEFAEEIKTEKSMAGYPVVRAFGTDKLVVAWTSNEKVYYTVVNANDIVTSINTRPVNTIAQTFSLPKMKLANSNDPVCGMPLSLSPGDTTLFRQKVYGFCSAVCKNHFVQKPEAFVKK